MKARYTIGLWVVAVAGLAFLWSRFPDHDMAAVLAFWVWPLCVLGVIEVVLLRNAYRRRTFEKRGTAVAGVVTAVGDTGRAVRGNAMLDLTVEYQRTDGTTAQTRSTQMVPRSHKMPVPGDRATVRYDGSGSVTVELGEEE